MMEQSIESGRHYNSSKWRVSIWNRGTLQKRGRKEYKNQSGWSAARKDTLIIH